MFLYYNKRSSTYILEIVRGLPRTLKESEEESVRANTTKPQRRNGQNVSNSYQQRHVDVKMLVGAAASAVVVPKCMALVEGSAL